jgi:hypothetical protein
MPEHPIAGKRNCVVAVMGGGETIYHDIAVFRTQLDPRIVEDDTEVEEESGSQRDVLIFQVSRNWKVSRCHSRNVIKTRRTGRNWGFIYLNTPT